MFNEPQDPHTLPATIQIGLFSSTYSIDEVDGQLYIRAST